MTGRERDALRVIREWVDTRGAFPSRSDVADRLGWTTSEAGRVMTSLNKARVIRWGTGLEAADCGIVDGGRK